VGGILVVTRLALSAVLVVAGATDRWVSPEDAALIRDLAAATPPPEP
jgi:hypothetical protein